MLHNSLPYGFDVQQSVINKILDGKRSDSYETFLQETARSLDPQPIISLASQTTLIEAAEAMTIEGASYALIQDRPDIILGVLRAEVLFEVLSDGDVMTASLSVSSVMDRNFCVEPDTVTIAELLQRVCVGHNKSCVIVDIYGNPVGAISLSALLALKKVPPSFL